MARMALTALGAAAGFAAGMIALPLARSATDGDAQSAYKALDRFGAAFATVRCGLCRDADDRKMIESALNGMIPISIAFELLRPENFCRHAGQDFGDLWWRGSGDLPLRKAIIRLFRPS